MVGVELCKVVCWIEKIALWCLAVFVGEVEPERGSGRSATKPTARPFLVLVDSSFNRSSLTF